MKKAIFILSIFLLSAYSLFAQADRYTRAKALVDNKDSLAVAKELNRLENSNIEEDVNVAIIYYAYKRNTGKRTALVKKAIAKFPKGENAFDARKDIFLGEPTAEKKEEFFKKLQKEFPGRDLSFEAYFVALEYVKEGDIKKMNKYLGLVTDLQLRPRALLGLTDELLKGENFRIAEPMIRSVMDTFNSRALKYVPKDSASKTQITRDNPKYNYYLSSNYYSKLLQKMGRNEEALNYSKEAYNQIGANNPTIIDQYMTMLVVTGRYKEAFPLMEKAIKTGTASKEVKEQLEKAYIAYKGTSDGFAEFKKNLDEELRKKIKEEVAKKIIKESPVDFTMMDTKGQRVSLSDLKGKTVVLDFWATWCIPCIKSFPSMQMAIEKYMNDTNVVFLFVHTGEHGTADPTEAADNFIKKRNFPFRVLIDKKDPVTSVNKVMMDYKVPGLPTKIILDPQGNIRFKIIGFSFGDDAVVEELSAMIELARTK